MSIDAKRCHEQALIILGKNKRTKLVTKNLADNNKSLGLILLLLGDSSAAIRCFRRIPSLRKRYLGPNHLSIAEAYLDWASALIENDPDAAATNSDVDKLLEHAKKNVAENLGTKQPWANVVKCYRILERSSLFLKNKTAADKYKGKAINIDLMSRILQDNVINFSSFKKIYRTLSSGKQRSVTANFIRLLNKTYIAKFYSPELFTELISCDPNSELFLETGPQVSSLERFRLINLLSTVNLGAAFLYLQMQKEYRLCATKEKTQKVIEFIKAHSNNKVAQFYLSEIFSSDNLGAKKDVEIAFHWCKQSAEQGYAPAQFSLFTMYLKGRGTDEDLVSASVWCKKAAEQDHAGAQYSLVINSKDKGLALQWYKRGSEQGDAASQYKLAEMIKLGLSPGEGEKQAFKWVEKAAEQKYVPALCDMGIMCMDSIGTKKDINRAIKCFRQASFNDGNEEFKNAIRRRVLQIKETINLSKTTLVYSFAILLSQISGDFDKFGEVDIVDKVFKNFQILSTKSVPFMDFLECVFKDDPLLTPGHRDFQLSLINKRLDLQKIEDAGITEPLRRWLKEIESDDNINNSKFTNNFHLADAAYDALINLAKHRPFNKYDEEKGEPTDPMSLCTIEAKNRVFTSTGFVYDIEYLNKWIITKNGFVDVGTNQNFPPERSSKNSTNV